MRKQIIRLFILTLLFSSCYQDPVKLVSVPGQWKKSEKTRIILQGVRKNNINFVGFWVDTIIRGGARPADTIYIPPLPGIKPGKHTLYLDLFHDKKHIQRIQTEFVLIDDGKSKDSTSTNL